MSEPAIRLTKVEAEQVARFVQEEHDRIPQGILVGRFSNGRLRLRRVGEVGALLKGGRR